MTNQERIQRIEELKELLAPLRRENLKLNLILHNRDYISEEEKIKLKSQIETSKEHISPIEQELNELRCTYEIEYDGRLKDIKNNTYYYQTYKEYYFLNECIDIDTNQFGWDKYLPLEETDKLIQEIEQTIYMSRFTRFVVKNIKRIK